MPNIKINIDKVPETCLECDFYHTTKYHCMFNDTGIESNCSLGFMEGEDMRDKIFRDSRYDGCKIEELIK